MGCRCDIPSLDAALRLRDTEETINFDSFVACSPDAPATQAGKDAASLACEAYARPKMEAQDKAAKAEEAQKAAEQTKKDAAISQIRAEIAEAKDMMRIFIEKPKGPRTNTELVKGFILTAYTRCLEKQTNLSGEETWLAIDAECSCEAATQTQEFVRSHSGSLTQADFDLAYEDQFGPKARLGECVAE